MSRCAALLSLVAAAAAWSCSGDSPAGPTPVEKAATRASVTTTGGTAHASNVPPQVDFRTTPAADNEGRITVTELPYEVKFNMCHLTDPDEGDDFHFTYDYEGTGNFEQGICRTSHNYPEAQCVTATVCATDQQPDHKVCNSYEVCTAGGGGGNGGGGGGPAVTKLQFWVWNGASSGNGTDSMDAAIDGTPVFGVTTGDPLFTAGYHQVTVDVSAFADGAAHQLSFSSSSSGPSNFSLDDVSIRCRSGANKVLDPGFEAGANFNPAWTQMSTTFASPICSQATCGDGGGTAKAHAGQWWVWFGGTSGAESASVVQGSITIPVCQ